jgi:hypothetical protein
VYSTLTKEYLELYFPYLDRKLCSVRCCESSFCVWKIMITLVTSKLHVISESSTAIHISSASFWQTVSTKVDPSFQLLVEGAWRQDQFSEGHRWNVHNCSFIVSIIMTVYWGRFEVFLRLLISMLLHALHISNFHGSSCWIVCHRRLDTLVFFLTIFHRN